ncbi:MAG: complex I NDUFA9 subunit family protein [Novosphingobium sp.]
MDSRNSLNGKLVTLIGGSGYVGRHVAQQLLAAGARVRVACRHPEKAMALKPLANLGQVQFVPCSVTHADSVAAAMQGADAAVYLVGAFDGNLDALHVRGPALAARAAHDNGATAFVLMSAIGADAASDVPYARTKAQGENAAREAFPGTTVLRASVLFGEDDKFINMFAGLAASLPILPVFGPKATMQPLWVDDAARAVLAALADPASHGGKTYEIAGPEALTMAELNHRIADAAARKPLFVELPDSVSGIIATLTGWLPGAPITSDQWKLLQAGNVPSGKAPGLKELGVTPSPLGLFLDKWMVRYRKHGRFGTDVSAVRR